MPTGPDPFTGAKAALICQGRILTYQRDDRPGLPWAGLWDLPGGGREGGEGPVDCLLREVWEEFGLRLRPTRLIWSRAFPAMDHPGQIGWFFAGPLAADEIASVRFGDEGQHWQMMPLDLWLARPDAVGPLQARTALALSQISPSEMTLD